jgi:hypothetical protein
MLKINFLAERKKTLDFSSFWGTMTPIQGLLRSGKVSQVNPESGRLTRDV